MLSLAGAVSVVLAGNTRAQDFFRDYGTSRSSGGIGPVIASEYTYRDTVPSGMADLQPLTPEERSEQDDQYNFAIGPVRFGIAAGFGVEFNDNITLSEDDRESDIILRPSLNVTASMPLNDVNTLRFNMGVSYAKYLSHNEYDSKGLLFSPNSELELKFQLGPVELTLRDRFSYQEEAYDIPQLSDVAVYRRYENQIGFQAAWAINQSLTLTAGYDHYNLWTVDDEFSSEERAIDTIFVKPTLLIAPGVTVGLNVAWSFINFETDERQDGDSLLVGPLVEWQMSEVTSLYFEVGFQQIKFDGTSRFDNDFFAELDEEERALFGDDEDSTSYYFKLELANRPTEFLEHSFTASKTAEIGFGSNYYDLYHFEYTARWKIVQGWELGTSLFYELYETSGSFNEEGWRAGAAVGVRRNLSNSITLGLDYRFLMKDSNLEDADYYQNLVFLSVHYKF